MGLHILLLCEYRFAREFYRMIEHERYISAAIPELIEPTFEVTNQYLQVMDVELENEVPKAARVNVDPSSESVGVYFSIKDESFYIVVNLSKDSLQVEGVYIESGHRVYLTSTSDELFYEELASHIPFVPLTGWSKGDMRKYGKVAYNFTRVSYEPNINEAYG